MDIEAVANVAEPTANAISCCETLGDSINQKSSKLKAAKAFFLGVDIANLVLDYMFTKQLSDMGEQGLSALSGAMTSLGFLVLVISKCALADAKDDILYKILSSELMIWVLEDLTTLYIFTVNTGVYDPSVLSSVVNLWMTIISGLITFAAMWTYLLFRCNGCLICIWSLYIIPTTFAVCYFTTFAFMYLIPAETMAEIAESDRDKIFTKLDSEMDPGEYLSVPTFVYIMAQSISWLNACYILCTICGPP